jgi:PDZ domain-containing protein
VRTRALVVAVAVAAVLAFAAWAVPASDFLIVPDRAKPLAERVKVEGEKPDRDGGGVYYVDVLVRRASWLERYVGTARPEGADLVPEHAIVPPGTDEADRRRANQRAMQRSQEIAAAVALRELGYDVKTTPSGALVIAVAPDVPAAEVLEDGDVITAVDGLPARTPDDLRRLVRMHSPGDKVKLRVRRGDRTRDVVVETVASEDAPKQPVIGVQVEQDAEIELPIDVDIDLGAVGGPSAGLAFALDVVEELGRDVDRGRKVVATGEIELDGGVAPVGGIKQKVIGARRSGADVFLVPAGENAAEAQRHAGNLRVIPVESFQQALSRLATLARKS